VLPVEQFRTERWTAIDADVNFKAAQITREKALPINNLDTQLHLKDGVLALTPLNFDIAGGRFTSTVMLDGSGKVNPTPSAPNSRPAPASCSSNSCSRISTACRPRWAKSTPTCRCRPPATRWRACSAHPTAN
jgi:hypothetical protein